MSLTEKTEFHFVHFPIFGYCRSSLPALCCKPPPQRAITCVKCGLMVHCTIERCRAFEISCQLKLETRALVRDYIALSISGSGQGASRLI